MKNLIGKKFGKWVVVEMSKTQKYSWLCECSCDKKTRRDVYEHNLLREKSVSCGCIKKDLEINKTHGKADSKIYSVWQHMIARCFYKKDKNYKNYGGRGITVCDKWLTFEGFYEDMGDIPFMKATLDRENSNDDYYKENCRWVNQKIQQNNRTNNRIVEYNGEKMNLTQWSEKLGIKFYVLSFRLDRLGWSIERAFTTKTRKLERK